MNIWVFSAIQAVLFAGLFFVTYRLGVIFGIAGVVVLYIIIFFYHRKIRRWALQAAINSLNSRFWLIRRDAVYTLGSWYWDRNELAVEALEKALNDKNYRVAIIAAKVLKNTRKLNDLNLKIIQWTDSRVLKVVNGIIPNLNHENLKTRAITCMKLAKIGFIAALALPKLKELAQTDSDLTVRNHAKRAIAKIEPLPYERLVELLNNPNWIERKYAAEALGYIGQKAVAQLPALREMSTTDDSRQVRDTAQRTIYKLENLT